MASVVYDILGETPFLDEERIDSAFADLTDADLERQCVRYRELILANKETLDAEIRAAIAGPRVIAGRGEIDLALLNQCAWYVDQFVVDDPLFAAHRPIAKTEEALNRLGGLEPDSQVDREAVVEATRQLRLLIPMGAAGYVRVYPFSHQFEPPHELPVLFSPTGFSDAIPTELLNLLRSKANVRRVAVREGKPHVTVGGLESLVPCRFISVAFDATNIDHTYLYQLVEQKVVEFDRSAGLVRFEMTVPVSPPSEAAFKVWVDQSVNQSARNVVRALVDRTAIAERFSAYYLTRSDLEAELLNLELPAVEDSRTATMTALLGLEIPFLEDVSVERLMRIRSEEGEAFEAFRKALEKQCRSVRRVQDPASIRRIAEAAQHELVECELDAVRRKVSGLRTQLAAEGAVAATGLLAATVSSGVTLSAVLLAAAQGIRTLVAYQREVQRAPRIFFGRYGRSHSRHWAQHSGFLSRTSRLIFSAYGPELNGD